MKYYRAEIDIKLESICFNNSEEHSNHISNIIKLIEDLNKSNIFYVKNKFIKQEVNHFNINLTLKTRLGGLFTESQINLDSNNTYLFIQNKLINNKRHTLFDVNEYNLEIWEQEWTNKSSDEAFDKEMQELGLNCMPKEFPTEANDAKLAPGEFVTIQTGGISIKDCPQFKELCEPVNTSQVDIESSKKQHPMQHFYKFNQEAAQNTSLPLLGMEALSKENNKDIFSDSPKEVITSLRNKGYLKDVDEIYAKLESKKNKKRSLSSLILEYLKKNGSSSVKQITKGVLKMGLVTKSKSPRMLVNSMLWKLHSDERYTQPDENGVYQYLVIRDKDGWKLNK
jgi:predicted CopG family antitoxin